MKIAVVIVSYRNVEDVTRCVDALSRSTHSAFEVVICENGGSAHAERMIEAIPAVLPGGQPVRVIHADNPGFAGGVNLGLRATPDADAWWVLNPDTVPEPGAMAALAAVLTQGDCDAVGGILHYADGRIQSLGGQWHGWLARAGSLGAGGRLGDSIDPAMIAGQQDYLMGASMLVSRSFLTVVGEMREDYFLYAEEIEWFLRAGRAGIKLGFAPDARVLHHQGTTTGWANDLRNRSRLPVYLDERNRIHVTRDHFPARLPVVAVLAPAYMVLRFARKRAWRQIGYGLQGWWAAMRGERGAPTWLGK
ncbi:glycosyltransferase family 2 protein [Sphingomonas sp. BGYR3]|uniref:glycosyltransferase family 2 protein n=1 Tax=Sphingomonas sp. BGYR3 TaxID=2975483 RepID=UPI0021A3F9CC|nr:glycosyltransferase family 2 protein [Sphingomonas sp. BGYR3]